MLWKFILLFTLIQFHWIVPIFYDSEQNFQSILKWLFDSFGIDKCIKDQIIHNYLPQVNSCWIGYLAMNLFEPELTGCPKYVQTSWKSENNLYSYFESSFYLSPWFSFIERCLFFDTMIKSLNQSWNSFVTASELINEKISNDT